MILMARGVWIGQAQARSLAKCGNSDLILNSRAVTSCRFLLAQFGRLCCGVLWCAALWAGVVCCSVVLSWHGVCLWCYREGLSRG